MATSRFLSAPKSAMTNRAPSDVNTVRWLVVDRREADVRFPWTGIRRGAFSALSPFIVSSVLSGSVCRACLASIPSEVRRSDTGAQTDEYS